VLDRSSFSSVGSLLHAHGAATEKAASLICQHVHGMMQVVEAMGKIRIVGVTAGVRATVEDGVKCAFYPSPLVAEPDAQAVSKQQSLPAQLKATRNPAPLMTARNPT